MVYFIPATSGCSVNNGGCQHHCVERYGGHYMCRCREGYRLKEDGQSCEGNKNAYLKKKKKKEISKEV